VKEKFTIPANLIFIIRKKMAIKRITDMSDLSRTWYS